MKVQTQVRTLAASVLCASTLLAGCGGGGTGLPHTHTSASRAEAAFTIHWPAHAVAAASTRSPKFISPSAMAVVVEVNPNKSTPGPITFLNYAGSPTGTVMIDAPVGSDEFVFTLWDQPQVAGETQPVGNELGQADVVQTIAANQTNNVNAVIGGITSHIAIAPLPNQPLVETDAGAGYDLVGEMPATFVATPQDADGNAIVAPGAPSLSVAVANGYASYVSVQPVNGNSSQFTVTSTAPFAAAQIAAQASNNAPNPVSVTVTATDAGVPHTANANLTLYQRSAMYVSYQGTAGAGAGIALYDDYGNYIPLPAGAFAGLTTPAGVAYDTATHQVFVADTATGAIMAFDALGNPVAGFPLAVPGSLAGARGIAYDPQSDTLFATGTSKVIAFKANGTAAFLSPSPFSKTSIPDAIAYISKSQGQQPDDEIAVANDSTKAIDYYYSNGAWIRTDTLKAPTGVTAYAPPIVGIAFNGSIYQGPVFVTGGPNTPSIAGYAIMEQIGTTSGAEFTNPGPLTSTTTRYGGVAISQTKINPGTANYPTANLEGYLVMTDANVIQGYIQSSSNGNKFSYPDVLITTPAASGLTNPVGIAVTSV